MRRMNEAHLDFDLNERLSKTLSEMNTAYKHLYMCSRNAMEIKQDPELTERIIRALEYLDNSAKILEVLTGARISESRRPRGRMMREGRRPCGRMLKESADNREELKFVTISDLSSLPSDIVPKCLRVLKEYDPNIYKKLVDENPELLNPDSLDDNEDGQFVYETMDELFKAMTEIAPEGFYFDAHPDDGGRYGFWPYDDEEWE